MSTAHSDAMRQVWGIVMFIVLGWSHCFFCAKCHVRASDSKTFRPQDAFSEAINLQWGHPEFLNGCCRGLSCSGATDHVHARGCDGAAAQKRFITCSGGCLTLTAPAMAKPLRSKLPFTIPWLKCSVNCHAAWHDGTRSTPTFDMHDRT